MFPKPSLGLPARGRVSGAGGVPWLLGFAGTKICWHHPVRDSPCQWLLLGCSWNSTGIFTGVRLTWTVDPGRKRASGCALRQRGCTRRSAGHHAQSLHPAAAHRLKEGSLAILEVRETWRCLVLISVRIWEGKKA